MENVNAKKITQIIMLLCLLICWLAVGIYFLTSDPRDYSAAERRKLALAPSLTFSSIKTGSYLTEAEAYAKDQFPAREFLRNAKAFSSLYGFLRFQDNGYTLRNGHLARLDMTFNQSSVEYACSHFRQIYDTYLADSDCRLYYCIIPDKNYYLNKLDPSFPTFDQTDMDAAAARLISFAQPIDIKDSLSLDSFYATDTHWRQDRLLPAAETILAQMDPQKAADESRAAQYSTETALSSFQGVLCGNMGWYALSEPMLYLTNDIIENAEVTFIENPNNNCTAVYNEKYLTYDGPGADPYFFFLSGNNPLVVIEKSDMTEEPRELIFFRDSFGCSIAPLFLERYDKITLVDTRYINPSMLGDYIEFTDQDVLFLYSSLLMNSSHSLKSPMGNQN